MSNIELKKEIVRDLAKSGCPCVPIDIHSDSFEEYELIFLYGKVDPVKWGQLCAALNKDVSILEYFRLKYDWRAFFNNPIKYGTYAFLAAMYLDDVAV